MATRAWLKEKGDGVRGCQNEVRFGHLTCGGGVLDSGTTDWFCCIVAGDFDKDGPPGKRACDPGEYTATILEVTTPLFRNMVLNEDDSVLSTTYFLDIEEPQFP